MAFTDAEYLSGAAAAWITFMTLLLLAAAEWILVANDRANPPDPWGVVGFLAVSCLVGGVVSFIVVGLGLLPARCMAKALRRQRRTVIHLACFALYGAVIGVIAISAVSLSWPSGGVLTSPLLPLTVTVTTISTTVGWLWARRGAAAAGTQRCS